MVKTLFKAQAAKWVKDWPADTGCEVRIFSITRMVVHGQHVKPAVCLSDLYDVFLLDIVRDTRQNLWTMIYRSQ